MAALGAVHIAIWLVWQYMSIGRVWQNDLCRDVAGTRFKAICKLRQCTVRLRQMQRCRAYRECCDASPPESFLLAGERASSGHRCISFGTTGIFKDLARARQMVNPCSNDGARERDHFVVACLT